MPTIRSGRFLGALCAALALSGLSAAQDAPQTEVIDERLWEPGLWTLQLEPAVWFAAMGGDVRVGDGAPTVRFKDYDADDPNASFSLRGLYRKDKWTVMVDGFLMSFDDGDAGAGVGELDFSLWSADAAVGYTAWERARQHSVNGVDNGHGAAVRIVPYAGLRALRPDLEVNSPGGAESESELFVHPIVGLRIEVEVYDRFSFDTGIDAGGLDLLGEDAVTLDWSVGLRFHPVENVAVQLGFRQMFMSVESDDLEIDGSVGGLMAGVTIRF